MWHKRSTLCILVGKKKNKSWLWYPIKLYLGDDVFELALLPGICRVVHHGDDGVVVLLVFVIQEDKFGPQVSLLCCSQDLWDVNSWPEELQMLPHLLGLELGIENGQLCEHPHVSTLQAQGSLQHGNQLLKVTTVLRENNSDGRSSNVCSFLG